MSTTSSRHDLRKARTAPIAVVAAAALVLGLLAAAPHADAAGSTSAPSATSGSGLRVVSFHGLRVDVPRDWHVVDLRSQARACVRFDRPVLYLGHAAAQQRCPAHLVGGAPALQLEALDERALRPVLALAATVPPTKDAGTAAAQLPVAGPAAIAVEGAGVLMTGVYGAASAELMRRIVASSTVLPGASATLVQSFPPPQTAPAAGASVPGTYRGKGFDACTAPSQAVMDGWRRASPYASIGIYIGGSSRGCGQANLTPGWVTNQVHNGWHLLPTYVGRQAPCTRFADRISYDVPTARAQGRAEARDAVAEAQSLGIAAPSTVYSDVEGYDNSQPSCVASVLGYLSGWAFELQRNGYEAGVYSSASSGIRDLSTHYDSPQYTRPDDIWIAWWNQRADVDGGSYVPDSQWADHQRVHQYAGNVTESYAGYTLQIDRNYLDVGADVAPPKGCPTDLDFRSYPMVTWGSHGDVVVAAQCLLARAGFDPGPATGYFGWRTASAARAFKASRNLGGDDSAVRRWAWTALASAGPTRFLKLGSTGKRVRKVQRALTARLQRPVPVSGRYDVETRGDVIAYQRLLHMTQTGTVGPVTWTALHSGL